MRKRTEDSFLLKNLDDADELPTFAQKRKKMYETVAQSAIRKPKTGRLRCEMNPKSWTQHLRFT